MRFHFIGWQNKRQNWRGRCRRIICMSLHFFVWNVKSPEIEDSAAQDAAEIESKRILGKWTKALRLFVDVKDILRTI